MTRWLLFAVLLGGSDCDQPDEVDWGDADGLDECDGQTCCDTDGGQATYTAGIAQGLDEVTQLYDTYEDSCSHIHGEGGLREGSWVVEHHCNEENLVATRWYKCSNGCFEGACQTAED